MLLIYVLIAALVLLVPLVVRPSVTLRRAGRLFALLAIVVVPVAAGFMGLSTHMERAKSVEFCLSCHVMEPYGKSLHVDDVDHVPASHYQYNRVPHDTACYTCHTDYTLFGDYKSKLRGLHHLWVQYLGTVPAKPHLYVPYKNRECLHCHEGGRSFLEAVTHKGRFDAIRSETISCVSSGCHGTIHDVDNIAKLPSWPLVEKAAP